MHLFTQDGLTAVLFFLFYRPSLAKTPLFLTNSDFFYKKSRLLPLIFRLSPEKNVKILRMSKKMSTFVAKGDEWARRTSRTSRTRGTRMLELLD